MAQIIAFRAFKADKSYHTLWRLRPIARSQSFMEQDFMEQGFMEQGFMEQGFMEQGFMEQGFMEDVSKPAGEPAGAGVCGPVRGPWLADLMRPGTGNQNSSTLLV
jgi:hypothetical protein